MSLNQSDYERFRRSGGYVDLSARAKLRFSGADRARYLNGQVTANIVSLKPGHACRACVTTAKGKLSADVIIAAHESFLLVDAAGDLRDALQARLEKYIIADDVTQEDATDELALLHLFAAEVPPGLPTSVAVVRARRFWSDGWDLLFPAGELSAVRSRLQADLLEVTPELLEVLCVEHGIPRWGRELHEDTLPPEAGLDRTHIDYHKGCYIGQEVISRIKSVGHVNRSLAGFVAEAGEPLQPGMRLFASPEPGRQIGELTSAAWSFALAKPIALGYLRRGSPTEDLLALPADADAPAVRVTARDLPFIP